MKNEIVKLGLILCVITSIAAGVLGFVNDITLPAIEAQAVVANDEARKLILPEADKFEQMDGSFEGNILEVYKGFKGSDIVGYTVKSTSGGYGGPIEIITGLSIDGKITGVTIGSMTETPGLGAKASEDAFKGQYASKEASELVVSKSATGSPNEIVAISGATITSRAVTKGVNESIELFKNQLNK
ncbi:MAG: RnfABCDGE type electron transport complex subunit G [Filifactoraceae bacterium]